MLPDLEPFAASAASDSHYSAAQNAAYVAWLDGFVVPETGLTVDEIMAKIGIKLADGSYSSLLQRYEKKQQRIRSHNHGKQRDLLRM